LAFDDAPRLNSRSAASSWPPGSTVQKCQTVLREDEHMHTYTATVIAASLWTSYFLIEWWKCLCYEYPLFEKYCLFFCQCSTCFQVLRNTNVCVKILKPILIKCLPSDGMICDVNLSQLTERCRHIPGNNPCPLSHFHAHLLTRSANRGI
jgi:hypothetical protein